MKNSHIAIIILHYKNLPDTRECLKSLQKISYSHYNVIIVNNDAPEHARLLKDEFSGFITVIQNEKNLGFAEGNNIGIRRALADKNVDAVLLLNNDTVVEPNFLNEMAKNLNSAHETQTLPPPPSLEGRGSLGIGMVAPRLMQYNDRDKVDNLGIVLMTSGLAFNRLDENQKLFCPSAGCALYSRKLLEAVALPHVILSEARRKPGGVEGSRESTTRFFANAQNDVDYFDPLYFAYAEDLDLGFRARNAGFEPAYAKDAIVYHKGSNATSKLSDLAVFHTYRNLLWTQYRNMPAILLLWQSPWLFMGRVFIFLFYLLKGRPGIIIKALIEGEIGILALLNKKNKRKKKYPPARKILSWFETGLFPRNLIK